MLYFLLRVTFWLSIVVILLPSDPARKADASRAQVSPLEALGAAQAAVQDASGFCERKPEACEIGSQALETFGQKAQYGSKFLYEFLSEHFGETPGSRKAANEAGEQPGRNTLTPADAAPAWSQPDHRRVPLPPRRPALS
jgi:hypothetical protein